MFTLAAFIVTKMIFPDSIYKKEMEQLAEAKVGSIVQFGKYEQDNVTDNGMEPVEWIVLEKKENALLVISKNVLDCKRYNETDACVTWESSSMRIWLNNSFLCEAFSNEELNNIAATTVKAGENLKYDTDLGTDTQDRVFLLSISEAESFFGSDSERRCTFTAYAKANDPYHNNQGWWLRSPGYYGNSAAYVRNDGTIYYLGRYVYADNTFVRPAMWINLDP